MLQSKMADDTKMFVREVDELLNVIGFVEIGRYYFENELLSTQLPSRSQVSHRQYYKLTRNSINQGHTTQAVPTGVLPRERCHGSAAMGAALHENDESGFEPVGAEERSYVSAA